MFGFLSQGLIETMKASHPILTYGFTFDARSPKGIRLRRASRASGAGRTAGRPVRGRSDGYGFFDIEASRVILGDRHRPCQY